jgi:UTP--glucose-1-phosphate uridylyltransferase
MSSVRDAIILAGGNGSRMLPASLYLAKEALPLVDTPILNHLVWEASKAGVSRIHIILSKRKMELLEQFLEFGSIFEENVRTDLPREALELGIRGVEIIPHLQSSPGGVADAISVALSEIKGPFLVLLGDNLLMDSHVGPKLSGRENGSNASKILVERFEISGVPNVGVWPVRRSEVEKYGVVELSENKVLSIVEKPKPSETPSNYILCGRYLLPENTSSILEKYPVSEYGELQSIQLLNHIIKNGGLHAVKFDGMDMYDSGDPLSWLKSQIDHALKRSDIREELSTWMEEKISDW